MKKGKEKIDNEFEENEDLNSKTLRVLAWPGNPGHVALRTRNIYVSFWPNDARNKYNSCCSVPGEFHTYEEDLVEEQRDPDVIVDCEGLYVDKIEEEFVRIKEELKHWNLCGSSLFSTKEMSNCAGIVAHLLAKGGINDIVKVDAVELLFDRNMGVLEHQEKLTRKSRTWCTIIFCFLFIGLAVIFYKIGEFSYARDFAEIALGMAGFWCLLCVVLPQSVLFIDGCVRTMKRTGQYATQIWMGAYTPGSIVRWIKKANLNLVKDKDTPAKEAEPILLEVNEPLELAYQLIKLNNAHYRKITLCWVLCCSIVCAPLLLCNLCYLLRKLNFFKNIENDALKEFEKYRVDPNEWAEIGIDENERKKIVYKQAAIGLKIIKIASQKTNNLERFTGLEEKLIDDFCQKISSRGIDSELLEKYEKGMFEEENSGNQILFKKASGKNEGTSTGQKESQIPLLEAFSNVDVSQNYGIQYNI